MISLTLTKSVSPEEHPNPASSDEFALIRRILAGDRDDYRILVERYQSMIFGMIMRQLGERPAAEDIAQESFIRAFQKLGQFRFDSKFSTWLTRIALNQLSNHFASKSFKKNQKTTPLEAHHEIPHHEVTERERLNNLRVGISRLDQIYQKVIIICGVEGQSYEDAAKLLEIPIGTVRSRLNKARLLLREELNAIEKEDAS